MLFPVIHIDPRDAIRDANADALTGIPQIVGYIKGLGWTHYDPRDAAASNLEPAVLFLALGKIPLPLSETNFDILSSIIMAG